MEEISSFMSRSVLVVKPDYNTFKDLGHALAQFLVIQTSAMAVNWRLPP